VDLAGAKVGEHGGSHRFTVGQRRGLRLGTPADDGRPRFVIAITPTTNTITVGPRNALSVKIISAIRPVWTGERPGSRNGQARCGSGPRTSIPPRCVRDQDSEVLLDSATTGVAAGQAVVLYSGSRVVGSATISATQA
jgi:tRNA-specific 2-thiouridylase